MDGRLIAGLGVRILATAGCTTHMKSDNTAVPSAARARIGAWGLDLAASDRSVKPGDYFFVPAGTPHQMKVAAGQRIRFIAFKTHK